MTSIGGIFSDFFWKLLRPPLIQFSKFNYFLWVCWFLGKNLFNFVPPVWKLHNPYCHSHYAQTLGLLRLLRLLFMIQHNKQNVAENKNKDDFASYWMILHLKHKRNMICNYFWKSNILLKIRPILYNYSLDNIILL